MSVEVRGPNPWFVLLVLGTLTAILGIWLIVSAIAGTNFSLGVIALLLAIGLFLNGLSEFVWAPGRDSPWIGWVMGVLFIIGGVIVLIRPGTGLRALAVVVGIVLIVVGLFQGAIALISRDEMRHWAAVAVFGLITIAIGIAAIAWPEATIRVIALLFGIRLTIIAFGTLGVGWDFKRLT